MSEHPRTPDANIEALIERMRQAARLYRALPQPSAADASDHAVREAASHLDSYLAELMRRSQPRSELPHRFRRFPFTIAPIGRLALRLYNLLTKDQRDVNLLLRDALQALQAAGLETDILAHSLGARVALELVDLWFVKDCLDDLCALPGSDTFFPDNRDICSGPIEPRFAHVRIAFQFQKNRFGRAAATNQRRSRTDQLCLIEIDSIFGWRDLVFACQRY